MNANEYPEHDYEFEDTTIRSVRREETGWGITQADGWSFFVPADSPVVPTVGMTARFYSKGIGHEVRGLFLAGRRVFYRTEREQAQKNRREQEEHDRQRRFDYERIRSENDRRIAALPGPFRDRIVGFRRTSPDWGWNYEDYELATCELAALIAASCGTVEAVGEFRAKSWEEQKAQIPDIDDGFSGNMFGAACNFAILFLADPESVPRQHATICPLVGCAAAGCWASRENRS